MIAFQISEEQVELVSLVRDVLKQEVGPLVLEMEQRNEQDFDWRPVESLARINMLALIGAIQVGIARAAYELILTYSRKREQFGRPIFSNREYPFPWWRWLRQLMRPGLWYGGPVI